MSERKPKVWGTTQELVGTEFYSKHHLETVAGGYCSLHFHKQRANRFTVVSGVVHVVTFYGPRLERVVLSGHGSLNGTVDVPSLVPHMFAVEESGIMYEEYYPDRGGQVRDDDIFRLTEGGIVDPSELDTLPYRILIDYINRPMEVGRPWK